MPHSGCPSNNRSSPDVLGWPFRQPSLSLGFPLPDGNLSFRLTKGRNASSQFRMFQMSNWLQTVVNWKWSHGLHPVLHILGYFKCCLSDDEYFWCSSVCSRILWYFCQKRSQSGTFSKSRKTTKIDEVIHVSWWSVHVSGQTASSGKAMKDYFVGRGSCWDGIDRTGMCEWMRSKTSRTPQQTHHWSSFISGPLELRGRIFGSWPSSVNSLTRRCWRSDISASWQTDFLFSSAVRLIPDYELLKHYWVYQFFRQSIFTELLHLRCFWIFAHLTWSFMTFSTYSGPDDTSDDLFFIFNAHYK